MSDRPTAGPPVLPTARPPVHPSARARAGAVLAPAVFVLLLALPIGTLPASAHRLAAVLGAVVVLWVTEALPLAVTALLGAAICVLLGVAPAKEVFAPFADPLMFLFIGAFILSRAIFLMGSTAGWPTRCFPFPGWGRGPAESCWPSARSRP